MDRKNRRLQAFAQSHTTNDDYTRAKYYQQIPEDKREYEDEFQKLYQAEQAYQGGLTENEYRRMKELEQLRANGWVRGPKPVSPRAAGIFKAVADIFKKSEE